MHKNDFLSLTFFLDERDLKKIRLLRRGDSKLDDDELCEICDSIEMFDNDVSFAAAAMGKTYYEICTTHGRHNLYLIEGIFEDEDNCSTVAVYNISDEINRLRTYRDLVDKLKSLKYKERGEN